MPNRPGDRDARVALSSSTSTIDAVDEDEG
jgi:hypothetical protein